MTLDSFLFLDRAGSVALLVGEYGRDGSTTRLARYPLDTDTGLLRAAPDGRIRPERLWSPDLERMQGAVLVDRRLAVTASRGRRVRGDLWAGSPDRLVRHRGVLTTGPQDLSSWPARRQLWTLSEWPGRRFVYAVDTDRWLTAR